MSYEFSSGNYGGASELMSALYSLPLSNSDAKELVKKATASHITLRDPVKAGAGVLYTTHAFAHAPAHVLDTPCVCAIGAFDGVHRGHKALLTRAATDARRHNARCIAVSFDPDPLDLVAPERLSMRLLNCADRRTHLAAASPGVHGVLVFPFTDELRNTTCKSFCLDVLGQALKICSIHVGTDFHMGYGRCGNLEEMIDIGDKHGFKVYGERLVGAQGERISATRIRRLLHAGRLAEAQLLLGRCYYLRGRLEHIAPTSAASMHTRFRVCCNAKDCLPAPGVYACYVVVEKTMWPAVVCIDDSAANAQLEGSYFTATLIGQTHNLHSQEAAVVFVANIASSTSVATANAATAGATGDDASSCIAWVQNMLGTRQIDC